MDELIILEIEGRATPEELDELYRWRSASEENERRYHETRALWVLMGRRQEIDLTNEVPSADGLLDALDETARGPATSRRRALGILAVAATLVLGFGLGHLVDFAAEPDGVVTAEFRTGLNELATAVLDDGSVARLAPGTTLRVTIGALDREVELRGRAFFAVAPDEDRPFLVSTPDGEIRVLGTRFEVDTARNSLRLLVVDGSVTLTARGGEAELAAGDLAEASGEAPPSVTRVEMPEALLDWMGTWMAFESTPIWRVAQELEVRLGLRTRIVDPAVAERTFSGWFAEEDRDQILEMICRVAALRCTTVDEIVLIEDLD